MAKLKDLDKKNYDFVIVGSNLTAGLLAYSLERGFHQSVAVIDSNDHLGREDSLVTSKCHQLMSHLMYFNSNKSLREALAWADHLVGADQLFSDEFDSATKTMDGTTSTEFLGYGERNFSSINELSSFSNSKVHALLTSPSELLSNIYDQFLGDTYTLAEVSQLNYADDRQTVASLNINGAKCISAKVFVYCLPPKSLEKKIVDQQKVLSSKAFHKIQKYKSFSKVRLHLQHSQAYGQSGDRFVLYGGKDDFEPCVGQCWSQNDNHYSLWYTLAPAELADDTEHMGAVVKQIKKQMKRLRPNEKSEPLAEKIIVEPDALGYCLQDETSPFGRLPKTTNFWLSHQQLVSYSDFTGKVYSAFRT